MSETEPDPYVNIPTEKWVFGGVRVSRDGTRLYAWIDPSGTELLYKPSGSPVVGSIYTARITRGVDDDGDPRVTCHGEPEYTGDGYVDPEQRRELFAQDSVARTRLAMLRAERASERRDALDEALEPLVEIAAKLRTGADRDAFAAYVLRKINLAWARGPR
jgi:hypothetical protein